MSRKQPQQQPRFVQTRDEAGTVLTVIDTTSGREYTALPLPQGAMTQRQAVNACKKLDFAGHKDWQLVSRQEATAILDLTRHGPAIDTDAFPNFPSVWIWTRDTCAWSSASAWSVGFSYGDGYGYRRYDDGFALAVRRSGQ